MKNNLAVITGAGGVLCGVFAENLASRGMKVALLDINGDAAKAVSDRIRDAGGDASSYAADVLSKKSLEAAREKILSDYGKCDLLINGAGGNNKRATTDKEYYEPGDIDSNIVSFFDLDPKGVELVFNLNFTGALLTTQVFAADMLGRGGNIINISSMNAFTPLTKIPAYSAAKAAVSNFTQWLAVHFAGENIRVNAIAPGFFVTNQNRDLLFRPDGTPTSRTDKILAATPMRRFGKPGELLGVLDFLADDSQSGFVTGTVIPVDGGFNAYAGV